MSNATKMLNDFEIDMLAKSNKTIYENFQKSDLIKMIYCLKKELEKNYMIHWKRLINVLIDCFNRTQDTVYLDVVEMMEKIEKGEMNICQ